MNENEVNRIANAINALRPDWPVASLRTLMNTKLGNRTRRDVAVVLTWVACESETKTPARVLEAGPWWNAIAEAGGSARPIPKWDELCSICSLTEDGCGRLRDTEHTFLSNAEHQIQVRVARGEPDDARGPRADWRERLAQAKAALCSHGVPFSHCAEKHETEEAESD